MGFLGFQDPPPGGGEGDHRTPKTPSGKQHPNISFGYFQNNLEIVRTVFLSIHWFRILLISASFLILSDISGLLQGRFSALYVSKIIISAADTEPMNNNDNKIIILESFLELAISAGL